MVFATIIGGVLSVGITLIAGYLLQQIGLYRNIGIINFFIFTGPIEETSKLLGFLFFIRLFKIQFDEPVDAVIYMSCVALGFSLIENLGYSLGTPLLLGVRSVTATPMHIIFSTTMALVFATNVSQNKVLHCLIKAILVASFFHGLYDALVFIGVVNTTVLYLLIMLAIYWGKKVFGYALLNSPHRKDILNTLSKASHTEVKKCIACGEKYNHNSYSFQSEVIDECQACESIVLPEKKAIKFLNHFLPHYQVFIDKNDELKKKLNAFFYELHDMNYNAHKRIKIKEASPLVEELAEEFRKNFEKSVTFSFVFATRPVLEIKSEIINEHYKNIVNNDAFKIMMTLVLIFGALGLFMWGLMAMIH